MEALIQVIESTIAARDPYTVSHQQRVTQIACTIGKEMGLSEDRLRELRIAGTLHDLGKIAIPSDLLSKPGELSSLEFALLKTHPQVAYNILKPIEFPGRTLEIILQHHERLDGSGYPQGLQGDEILLEARILGVADVMDAMTSHRPYRASLGLAETLEELSGNQGILYDTAVVQTCLMLYGEKLPAVNEVRSELASPEAGTPQSPVVPGAMLPAPGNFPHLWAGLQGKAGKPRNWATLLAKGHRAWMRLGMASILGFLGALSFKIF
jgi:HD-GYP domain-containing protein (c-di-GMP phosphodiesterase class II)